MKRVGWLIGLISPRSHYRADGAVKQTYPTREAALKAVGAMSRKTGREFDAYRCWFRCRKWHIGGKP